MRVPGEVSVTTQQRSSRRYLIAFTCLLLVQTLSSCGGPGSDLKDLQSDPMARYTPPGTKLTRHTEESRSLGGSFGKPHSAEIHRAFSIPPGTAEPLLLDLVFNKARDAGWAVIRRDGGVSGARYAKGEPGAGTATLSAYVGDNYDSAGRQLILVMTNPDSTTIRLPPK